MVEPVYHTLLALFAYLIGFSSENVLALEGLDCRARVAPVSSPALHCKQCSALTSHSLHAQAEVAKNIKNANGSNT